MKNFFICFSLVVICSCGRTIHSNLDAKNGVDTIEQEGMVKFGSPQLNVQRTITVDNDISILYEDMTVRSNREETILGDDPFYLLVTENVSPIYNSVELGFYSSTKVKNVFYIDTKKYSLPLEKINKENLSAIKLEENSNFFKNGLVWGEHNVDNPGSDMLDKAFVIRTEGMEKMAGKEYHSLSTYLVWFKCESGIQVVDQLAYSCSKFDLKFHYVLLDYSLTSNKI